MKTLIIVEGPFEYKHLLQYCQRHQVTEVHLFSLTDDFTIVRTVIALLKPHFIVKQINSAILINEQVSRLRHIINTWSHELSESKVKGRTLKEWFLIPSMNVSTWWFSQLAEKNTMESNAFFHLAQVEAVKQYISQHVIETAYFAVHTVVLRRALKNVLESKPVTNARLVTRQQSVSTQLKNRLKSFNYTWHYLFGIYMWFKYMIMALRARIILPTLKKRIKKTTSILIISSFPNVDRLALQQGKFINCYYAPLQKLLEKQGETITWIMNPVPFDNISYSDTLSLAKQLIEMNTVVYMQPEFFTFKQLGLGIVLWFRQIMRSQYLWQQSRFQQIPLSPFGKESEPIIHDLWLRSFVGYTAVRSLYNLLSYRQAFSRLKPNKKMIYFWEMQCWEKAMLSALKSLHPDCHSFGFQHTTSSANYFHQFCAAGESKQTGEKTDMPLPNTIVTNGQYMLDMLSDSNYPNLRQAEAIRNLKFHHNLSAIKINRTKQLSILIAGPMQADEMRALVMLTHQAFSKDKALTIIFKGHPCQPFEPVFKAHGIDISNYHYQFSREEVNSLLKTVWAVLVPSSTVALEALAMGCEVIVPLFQSSMVKNPLLGHESFYHQVSSPQELRQIVQQIAATSAPGPASKEKALMVEQYWDLDPSLSKWQQLLIKP